MKNINIITMAISGMFILSACTSSNIVAPSQNSALNDLTNTGKNQKSGLMQQSLDTWLSQEWTPTVEKNETIKTINEDKGRNFTFQEYVDKMEVYIKESASKSGESQIEKLNSLPVIGK